MFVYPSENSIAVRQDKLESYPQQFQKDTMKNIAAIAVLAATRVTSTQVGSEDKLQLFSLDLLLCIKHI
jgi:hypothetical protein